MKEINYNGHALIVSAYGAVYKNFNGKHKKLKDSGSNFYRGYKRIKIINDHEPKKVEYIPVHKIVAHAFLGECPEGYCVEHIDGNTKNNCHQNLRYTPNDKPKKENVDDYKGIRCEIIELNKTFTSMNKALEYLREINLTTTESSQKIKECLDNPEKDFLSFHFKRVD